MNKKKYPDEPIHEQLNFFGYGYGYGWDTHNWQYTRDNWKTRVSNRQYTRGKRKYIKYCYFYTYLVLFLMNMIKLSVLKNRLSGILSVGYPNISVVSGILSVGHPSFSVVSGIFSVPIPIPEEIQLLMYGRTTINWLKIVWWKKENLE